MNIAIFSKKEEYPLIENVILKFNKLENANIVPLYFSSQKSLIENIENDKIKIIFINNSEDDENIFSLAEEINKRNKKVKIIFISKTEKFALRGYKIELYYYTLIPLKYEEFSFITKKYYKNLSNIITINSNWQKIPVLINDIHFIEKQGHNVIIHTTNQKFKTRTTFRDFLENFKYKRNFLNCIRGTVVNFDWVEDIKSQNFLMKNGEKIPIRRKDRKKIKELFYAYKLQKSSS